MLNAEDNTNKNRLISNSKMQQLNKSNYDYQIQELEQKMNQHKISNQVNLKDKIMLENNNNNGYLNLNRLLIKNKINNDNFNQKNCFNNNNKLSSKLLSQQANNLNCSSNSASTSSTSSKISQYENVSNINKFLNQNYSRQIKLNMNSITNNPNHNSNNFSEYAYLPSTHNINDIYSSNESQYSSQFGQDLIYQSIKPRSVSQMFYNSINTSYSKHTSDSVFTAAPGSRQPINVTDTNEFNKDLNKVILDKPISKRQIESTMLYNNSREAEVDYLTKLLVKEMQNITDSDFFGMCYKCGEKIFGEGNGCTAMNQLYHNECFTCNVCKKTLKGLQFYSIDGKPYCEFDYLNTLEKCYICNKPILDRILRAIGNIYHPECFCCVACGKCMDGVLFTVDYSNHIYCIKDFNKNFAPKCCVCKTPILPKNGQHETFRIVALERSFHVECYKCEDCNISLSSDKNGQGCYPLDDHILCKTCNNRRFQELLNNSSSIKLTEL